MIPGSGVVCYGLGQGTGRDKALLSFQRELLAWSIL